MSFASHFVAVKEVPPHPADPVEKPISTKSELPFVEVK